MLRRFALTALVLLVLGGFSFGLGAQEPTPTPGVVAGNFTTYQAGFLKTHPEAAQSISQYFALNTVLQPALNGEFFHVGVAPYAYTWRRTGTPAIVGKGKKAVQVDFG